MNLLNSSFLCLDIGTSGVRGIGVKVRDGRVARSELVTCESTDTGFALTQVVDELEHGLGTHFDSVYITGNLGETKFTMRSETSEWAHTHKITDADILHQIVNFKDAIHVFPLRYDLPECKNIADPAGQMAHVMRTIFGVFSVEKKERLADWLREAHLQARQFFDPLFLVANTARKGPAAIIDIGAEQISGAVWTNRGPMVYSRLPLGLARVSDALSARFDISFSEAERVKKAISLIPSEMDRFTPSVPEYEFSRADAAKVAAPLMQESLAAIWEELRAAAEKCEAAEIILTGGGAEIEGMSWDLPVRNLGANAAVKALAAYIWKQEMPHAKNYLAHKKRWAARFAWLKGKQKKAFVPVMPSTLAFNMHLASTYSKFDSANISMIHCDVMDGFFVDRIALPMTDLALIRRNTRAHLHLHLMTENPVEWAREAARAGADTIIVSTGVSGVKAALKEIKKHGKRAGIALNPNSPIDIIKPILKEIDEILVMSVVPGAGGQKFLDPTIHKISTLANTRKKYGLKLKISVDGGITPETAKRCWDAGADYLVSGKYLADAADFPLAVQSLLPA